jgi:hypothetical protein
MRRPAGQAVAPWVLCVALAAMEGTACGGDDDADADGGADDAAGDRGEGPGDVDAASDDGGAADPGDAPADPYVDAADDGGADDVSDGAADAVYPGATWDFRTPAEAGMSASALESFADYVGGRGCVVRGGTMVHAWGDQGARADVASACKPLFSHFLFVAIEDGRLAGPSAPVVDHEPRLADLNAGLGHKDRGIEWRHLANQTSCYGVREAPGTAFDYSDYNMALFFDTLFLGVFGSTWDAVDDEVLRPRLTDVLQCEDDPTFMIFGAGDRPGRTGLSVRDFARFGLLYLREGRWRDVQLLSAEHVRLLTGSPTGNEVPRTAGEAAEMIPGQRSIGGGNNQTDHLGSYSYAWWTNGTDRDGLRHWPDAPADAYGAFGHGGPRALVVIPSLDLVVSWNDSAVDTREAENEALRRLVEAVVE